MDRAVKNFKNSLKKSGLKEVSSPEGCHFFLFFCPIISRAGTDIDAAVKYLKEEKEGHLQASKPVIMVVLHHTFDPEKIILDSNTVVKREDLSAVDCLFDDNGLLSCPKNTDAIRKIQTDSKSKKWTSYYCLKKDLGNPCLSTNQDAEDGSLIPSSGSVDQPNTRDVNFFMRCWHCFCNCCCLPFSCNK